MYKLYKSLGIKIFNIIEKNYFLAKKYPVQILDNLNVQI